MPTTHRPNGSNDAIARASRRYLDWWRGRLVRMDAVPLRRIPSPAVLMPRIAFDRVPHF